MSFKVETTAGTRASFPASSGVAAPPADIIFAASGKPVPQQQVLSIFTSYVSIPVPALTSNTLQSLSFQIPLTSFPTPFSVAGGSSAVVQASLALNSPPSDATTTVQTPSLTLSAIKGGSPLGGSGDWTLQPGSYSNMNINVTVGVSSAAASVAAQTLTFVCHAQLIGSPTPTNPTQTLTPGVQATSGPAPTGSGPQATALALVAGSVTWTFPAPYTSNPVVVATPYGAPASGTPEVYIDSISPTAVIVNSTSNTDTRLVGILATVHS